VLLIVLVHLFRFHMKNGSTSIALIGFGGARGRKHGFFARWGARVPFVAVLAFVQMPQHK